MIVESNLYVFLFLSRTLIFKVFQSISKLISRNHLKSKKMSKFESSNILIEILVRYSFIVNVNETFFNIYKYVLLITFIYFVSLREMSIDNSVLRTNVTKTY